MTPHLVVAAGVVAVVTQLLLVLALAVMIVGIRAVGVVVRLVDGAVGVLLVFGHLVYFELIHFAAQKMMTPLTVRERQRTYYELLTELDWLVVFGFLINSLAVRVMSLC